MVYGACYLKGTRFFDRGGWYDCRTLSSFRPLAYWDSSLRAFFRDNSGSAPESAGNNRKEGVHVAAVPAPFLVNGAAGSASTIKDRIHFR